MHDDTVIAYTYTTNRGQHIFCSSYQDTPAMRTFFFSHVIDQGNIYLYEVARSANRAIL